MLPRDILSRLLPRLLPRCSSAKENFFWDKRWIQYLTRTYKPWEEERGDAGVQLSSPVWIWKQLPKPVRHFWKTLHTRINIFVNSNMWVKLPPASDFINRWAHSVLNHGSKNLTNEMHHSWGHSKVITISNTWQLHGHDWKPIHHKDQLPKTWNARTKNVTDGVCEQE